MPWGKRNTTLVLILILIGMIIPTFPVSNVSGDLSNPSVLSTHSTISINGDSQFNATNGVVSGQGTEGDPYIIENWSIELIGINNGICIQNTKKYFIIRNCHIFNKTFTTKYGIYINKVENGIIEDNKIDNNYNGIYLYDSKKIRIWNNSIHNNYYGINSYKMIEIIIENNTIYNNEYYGIYGRQSDKNIISNNSIFNNTYNGINFPGYNDDNKILNNSVNISNNGIYISGSNNIIFNNTIFNNSVNGLNVNYLNNKVCHNIVYNNLEKGIYISGSNTKIYNNIIFNNSQNGCYISNSNNNIIFNNTIYNNSGNGIVIDYSNFNTLYNNTIFNNSYNFGVIGIQLWNFNHTIYSNNTIDNKRIYYWLNKKNTEIPSDAGYIGLVDCYNITLRNFTLKNNYQGIILFSTLNCTIENNTLSNNYYGIWCYGSSNNKIFENKIEQNVYYGIYFPYNCNNNLIFNCTINNNSKGISIFRSDQIIIRNNSIFNNDDRGLFIQDSFNKKLFDNVIFNNTYNFGVRGSKIGHYNHTIPTNNTVNGKPIYYWVGQSNKVIPSNAGFVGIVDCNNITVKDLTLSQNYFGITLAYANNNRIANNNIFENYDGIFFDHSDSNLINENSIHNHTDGIYIVYSDNNEIFNNTIKYNTNGITHFVAEYNIFYNNYFKNIDNGGGFPGLNSFNISRTVGINIVGGPFIGGNYWSDYTGSDINGDGFGDTNLPHPSPWGNDHLPLCKNVMDLLSPTVFENSTPTPTTGDKFIFNASILDWGRIENAKLEYWFDHNPKNNITFPRVFGDNINGTYQHEIDVPEHAFKLNFVISAVDLTGNWNKRVIKVLDVADNDAPGISNVSLLLPTTGDSYKINFSVHENIDLTNVFVSYRIDNKQFKNNTLKLTGDSYILNLNVPLNAKTLDYIISAVDSSSNWASVKRFDLNVIDNDMPTITDIATNPKCGEFFKFKFQIEDNIEISSKTLEYWFDEDTHYNITLPADNSYLIEIPVNAITLHTIVTVIDSSNNINHFKTHKKIVDDIVPEIEDVTADIPYTAKAFKMKFSIYENQQLKSVIMNYWLNKVKQLETPLTFEDEHYTFELVIPKDTSELHITLFATDISNNTAKLNKQINVTDIIPPTPKDLTTGYPSTGEDYTIVASAEDNIRTKFYYLEFWFNDEDPKNISFFDEYDIFIPIHAETLHYIISVCDSAGNFGAITVEVPVIDIIPPLIEDTIPEPTTGDEIGIYADIYEDIRIILSKLEYWFDDGESKNVSYNGSYIIEVPDNARMLYYKIYVVDYSRNSGSISRAVEVKDNDEPIIIDHSSEIENGYKFKVEIEENIEIVEVKVDYWIDDNKVKYLLLEFQDGMYEGTISIQGSATEINYQISADDDSGNRGRLEILNVKLEKVTDSGSSEELKGSIIWAVVIILIIIMIIVVILWVRKKKVEKKIHSEDVLIVKPIKPQVIIQSQEQTSQGLPPPMHRDYHTHPPIVKPSELTYIPKPTPEPTTNKPIESQTTTTQSTAYNNITEDDKDH